MRRVDVRWVVGLLFFLLIINVNSSQVFSLAGPWQFAIETGEQAGFEQPGFDAAGWDAIPVPAHWELHGHGAVSYRHPSDEVGLYRKTFTLPEGWEGLRVSVYFEGVYNGATVFLNGRQLAYHEGGYHPFYVELTPALRKGENLLALRVKKKIEHYGIDDGDFWQLGGIFRRCELQALPKSTALVDYLWQTPPDAGGMVPSGEVLVQATLECSGGVQRDWEVALLEGGRIVASERAPMPAGAGAHALSALLRVKDWKPWTAETPNLYRLRLRVLDGETVHQEEQCNLGFRVAMQKDGVFYLNGVPIKLRGTGTLDIWPDVGRSVTREMYEKDVRLLREANINLLRPGWTGCGADLMDIADRQGLYLIGEVPFANVPHQYLTDAGMIPEFLSRTQESIRFFKNSPSVIIYSVGNENSYLTIHPPLLAWIKQADDSRPVLFPRGQWASWPHADMISFHYSGQTILDHIKEMEKRDPKRPLIYTEYNHGLWDSGGGLEQMWAWMQTSPLVAGGCQFAWCDQGLRYKKDGRWVLDTQGVYGSDGIVTADRRPTAEYWQMKNTYCPIQVVDYTPGDRELRVENRHDFTPLGGYSLKFSCIDGDDASVLAEKTVQLPNVKAHARGKVSLPFDSPPEGAAFVQVSMLDPEGNEMGWTSLRTRRAPSSPASRERPRLVAKVGAWEIAAGGAVWTLDPATAQLVSVAVDGKTVALSGPSPDFWRPPFPHLDCRGARDTLVDDLLPETPKVELLARIESPTEAGGLWLVEYAYAKSDWPDYVGFRTGYRLTVDGAGRLHVLYAHTYTGRASDWMRRWGVAFDAPGLREIRYHGNGPDRSYPDKWAHQRWGSYTMERPREVRRTFDNRHGVDWIQLSGDDGDLALCMSPAAGLRVDWETDGDAHLGVATHVEGIGNKGQNTVEPVHRVIPAAIHTASGALLVLPPGRGAGSWKAAFAPDWSGIDDGDGIPAMDEMARGGNPLLADTDGDGRDDASDPAPLDADAPLRRTPGENAKATPPRLAGDGWVWVEGEAAAWMAGTERDARKPDATLDGVCLTGFQEANSGAAWSVVLPSAIPDAVLGFRVARADPGDSRLGLRVGGGSDRTVTFASTGGWGYAPGEWKWQEVALGDLSAGSVLIELFTTGGPDRDGVNIDGFFIMNKGAKPKVEFPGEEEPKQPIEAFVPCRQVTPDSASHWFGYYDKHQFDPTGRYLLSMEVDFDLRSPTKDDVIRLGMVDLQNGDKWIPLSETRAWGWQQGCMFQWVPGSKTKVIYNDRQGETFVSIIQDVFTGEKRVLPRAIYTLSPDGKTAVSVNFARIDSTRPGYGYEGGVDPFADDLHPKGDGIYVMNMETGESKLVVTLDQIARTGREIADDEGKHWFNHLLFNTDGSRFEFLHRWYRQAPMRGGWATRMFTANTDGSDVYCVDPNGRTSHFIWRDPTHILCWTWTPKYENAYTLFTDKSEQIEVMGPDVLTQNGHMTYSPDGEWVLTDTYPDKQRMQTVFLYRPADGKVVTLGKFHSPPEYKGEVRTDTHPRWNRDGTAVCIDSSCSGRRQMYLLDVSGITR